MPPGLYQRTPAQLDKLSASIKKSWAERPRRPESRICTNCGASHTGDMKLRCEKCYVYWKKYGVERPGTVKVGPPSKPYNLTGKCCNCGKETEKRMVKGRCSYCYNYLNKHGVDPIPNQNQGRKPAKKRPFESKASLIARLEAMQQERDELQIKYAEVAAMLACAKVLKYNGYTITHFVGEFGYQVQRISDGATGDVTSLRNAFELIHRNSLSNKTSTAPPDALETPQNAA